jgi:hypothetical protein
VSIGAHTQSHSQGHSDGAFRPGLLPRPAGASEAPPTGLVIVQEASGTTTLTLPAPATAGNLIVVFSSDSSVPGARSGFSTLDSSNYHIITYKTAAGGETAVGNTQFGNGLVQRAVEVSGAGALVAYKNVGGFFVNSYTVRSTTFDVPSGAYALAGVGIAGSANGAFTVDQSFVGRTDSVRGSVAKREFVSAATGINVTFTWPTSRNCNAGIVIIPPA